MLIEYDAFAYNSEPSRFLAPVNVFSTSKQITNKKKLNEKQSQNWNSSVKFINKMMWKTGPVKFFHQNWISREINSHFNSIKNQVSISFNQKQRHRAKSNYISNFSPLIFTQCLYIYLCSHWKYTSSRSKLTWFYYSKIILFKRMFLKIICVWRTIHHNFHSYTYVDICTIKQKLLLLKISPNLRMENAEKLNRTKENFKQQSNAVCSHNWGIQEWISINIAFNTSQPAV